MNLKITTLIENNADENKNLFNEHGLSFYIEADENKILFDTGKSGKFIENAGFLNIDLSKLNYVFMSHGHYDHSGGFEKFVNKFGNSYKLFVGKGFFNEKYKSIEEDAYKFIGNSFNKAYIDKNHIDTKLIEEDIFYINEDIMVFSNFKSHNSFEHLNKKFQIKENENYVLDDFSDEIVLAVKVDKGLMIILGCSHIGIVNILETIIDRTGMPIYGIIGGTHLIEADELRLNSTIDFLKEKNIQIIGMCHCTGEKAAEKVKEEFGEKFFYSNTGSVIKII